jgi:hypothetical protein
VVEETAKPVSIETRLAALHHVLVHRSAWNPSDAAIRHAATLSSLWCFSAEDGLLPGRIGLGNGVHHCQSIILSFLNTRQSHVQLMLNPLL